MSDRNLTDEDVKAIVGEMEKHLKDTLYKDVGRGVMGFVWKALIVIILTLAAYGAGAGKIGGQ